MFLVKKRVDNAPAQKESASDADEWFVSDFDLHVVWDIHENKNK